VRLSLSGNRPIKRLQLILDSYSNWSWSCNSNFGYWGEYKHIYQPHHYTILHCTVITLLCQMSTYEVSRRKLWFNRIIQLCTEILKCNEYERITEHTVSLYCISSQMQNVEGVTATSSLVAPRSIVWSLWPDLKRLIQTTSQFLLHDVDLWKLIGPSCQRHLSNNFFALHDLIDRLYGESIGKLYRFLSFLIYVSHICLTY
jgi:hypothetical protein